MMAHHASRTLGCYVLFIFALGVLSIGCGGNSVAVKASDYGDDWPLTIPEAKLICEQPSAVYLEVDGKHYGVNGFGKNYVSKEYSTTARELAGPFHSPAW